MDVKIIKRCNMFTWITQQELEWLLVLEQLEDRQEELEIDDIADGLNKLSACKNLGELREVSECLRGLQEERLIEADTVDLENRMVSELRITCRGRKVLAEAKCILFEAESETAVVFDKLQKENKKQERKDALKGAGLDLVVGITSSLAETVLNRVFGSY